MTLRSAFLVAAPKLIPAFPPFPFRQVLLAFLGSCCAVASAIPYPMPIAYPVPVAYPMAYPDLEPLAKSYHKGYEVGRVKMQVRLRCKLPTSRNLFGDFNAKPGTRTLPRFQTCLMFSRSTVVPATRSAIPTITTATPSLPGDTT